MSQRSLTHQVGILTAGRVIAYVAMFIVPLVNVRVLSVEDYGYYRQFWLLVETLVPILVLAFGRGILYYLPRAESKLEAGGYVTQTLLGLCLTATLGLLVYFVMGATLGAGMGAMVRLFMVPLCLFTFVKVTTNFLETLFLAEGKVVAQSAYHAAAWGVQALVVIAVSYFTRDVVTIVWALAILGLVRFVFMMGYIQVMYRFTLRHLSLHSMKEMFSFALPVGLAATTVTLLTQTDKFIINRFMGREEFAIYAVGAFQVPLVNVVKASISSVTFPPMVRFEKAGQHAAVLELWQRALLKTLVIMLPIFVFLEVTARPFITILFTEDYAAATPIFMIYLLLFMRSGFESTVPQVYKRTRFILITSTVALVLNLLLGVLLFQTIGRLGPPISAVITMSGLNLVHLWYSAQLMQATFFQVFPIREVAKRFAAAIVPGIVAWVVCRYFPVTEFHHLVLACAGYTLLYAGVCAATGLVTVNDVRALLGRGRVSGG